MSSEKKPEHANIKASLDFPGGPGVKTLCFHCRELGSIPGQGTKLPHAALHGHTHTHTHTHKITAIERHFSNASSSCPQLPSSSLHIVP